MCMKDDMKERLYQHGPEVLTNAELIALILRKGKRNVSPLCVAESIASEDRLYRQLAACHSVDDILYQYSLTQEQAQALLAAMELGRRMVLAGTAEATHITSPGDAAQYLMGRLRYETHSRPNGCGTARWTIPICIYLSSGFQENLTDQKQNFLV